MWILALALAAQTVVIKDPAYVEAMRLVDEFEYERAVFRFREALRREQPDEERAVIELQLGITYAELGESEDAIIRFADALAHDSRVAVPARASPKAKELFEAGRQRLRERKARDKELTELRSRVAAFESGKPVDEKPASDPANQWEPPDHTLAYIGAGTALLGGVVIVSGLGAQLYAIDQHQQGVAAAFQDDAARFSEASVLGQQIAYGLLGPGAALALAGGTLILVGE